MSTTCDSPKEEVPATEPASDDPLESADPPGDDPHGFVLDTQGELDYEELLEDPLEAAGALGGGEDLLEGREDLLGNRDDLGDDPLEGALESGDDLLESGDPLGDGDPLGAGRDTLKSGEKPQAVNQVSLHKSGCGLSSPCDLFSLSEQGKSFRG